MKSLTGLWKLISRPSLFLHWTSTEFCGRYLNMFKWSSIWNALSSQAIIPVKCAILIADTTHIFTDGIFSVINVYILNLRSNLWFYSISSLPWSYNLQLLCIWETSIWLVPITLLALNECIKKIINDKLYDKQCATARFRTSSITLKR